MNNGQIDRGNENPKQHLPWYGAKGDWDFQISDLVKNHDGTNI